MLDQVDGLNYSNYDMNCDENISSSFFLLDSVKLMSCLKNCTMMSINK